MGITHTTRSGLKAQSEIVSTILLIGISIAAISVAYLWGLPLIEKGQSSNKIASAENTMRIVDAAISDVVKNGGQKSVEVNLDGSLEVSSQENSIIYRITTKKAGVATTEWIPMNEDDTFSISYTPQNQTIAVYGADKSGVIVAKATSLGVGNEYTTEYRLTYRVLVDPGTKEGQIVVLAARGNNKVLSGRHILVISREHPVISTEQTTLGGVLTTTQVFVTLS
jgi:hypothetical protein